MTGDNAQLDGGQELTMTSQKDVYLGSLLRRIILAVNTLATNATVSAIGKLPPPPKVDSIQVQGTQTGNVITCPSEILHWTLTHNQSVSKGIRYFSEVDTDPNFPNPHVVDHGTSRTGFLTLPTFSNAANMTSSQPTAYYLRSYAQYHGSDPCAPTVLGNFTGSTQIFMGGTGGSSGTGSVTQLLSSTGSGTASPQGQQGGKGLGTIINRPKPQPKRSVGLV